MMQLCVTDPIFKYFGHFLMPETDGCDRMLVIADSLIRNEDAETNDQIKQEDDYDHCNEC